MELLQYILIAILAIVVFYIACRLFWKSAFKGFFEALEEYKQETNKEDKTRKE
jgi:septation ring formation regulator EzrA